MRGLKIGVNAHSQPDCKISDFLTPSLSSFTCLWHQARREREGRLRASLAGRTFETQACLNIYIIAWTFLWLSEHLPPSFQHVTFFIFTKLVLQIGELVGKGLNDRRVPVSKDHESSNAIDWRDKSYILETLAMSWGLPHQGPWGPGILGRKRTYIYTSLPGPPLSSIFTLQTLCL